MMAAVLSTQEAIGTSVRIHIRQADVVRAIIFNNKVDLAMFLSVARIESNFQPLVKSHAGAKGVFQITSIAVKELKRVAPMIEDAECRDVFSKEIYIDLYNIFDNIFVANCYLIYLAKLYNNNTIYMLIAYNAGGSQVKRFIRHGIKSIPKETQSYIENYKKVYPKIIEALTTKDVEAIVKTNP